MLKTATRFVTKFTRSLSFKLSFYTAFIMFLALLAFAYHSISAQEDNLITKMIQGALKDSEVIKAAIWNGMMTKDRAVIKQIVQTIGSQEGFKEINIYDAKGVLHYTSKPDLANERLAPQKNPLLEDIGTNTSVRHTISQSGKSLLVVNPLLNEKELLHSIMPRSPRISKGIGRIRGETSPGRHYRRDLQEHQEDRGFCLLALHIYFDHQRIGSHISCDTKYQETSTPGCKNGPRRI